MELAILQKDMIAAMKAKDKPRKDAISALVSAVKKAGIDAGCREDIPESMVDQFRYDVISAYAPKLLSAEEVKAILQEKFADLLATKNKGMIMKTVMAELKGKADGKVINQVVAELCK